MKEFANIASKAVKRNLSVEDVPGNRKTRKAELRTQIGKGDEDRNSDGEKRSAFPVSWLECVRNVLKTSLRRNLTVLMETRQFKNRPW